MLELKFLNMSRSVWFQAYFYCPTPVILIIFLPLHSTHVQHIALVNISFLHVMNVNLKENFFTYSHAYFQSSSDFYPRSLLAHHSASFLCKVHIFPSQMSWFCPSERAE